MYEYRMNYLTHIHNMSKSSSEVWSLLVLTSYIHRRRKSQASKFFAGGLDLKKIFIPFFYFPCRTCEVNGDVCSSISSDVHSHNNGNTDNESDISGVCYRSCSSA